MQEIDWRNAYTAAADATESQPGGQSDSPCAETGVRHLASPCASTDSTTSQLDYSEFV